MLTPDIIRELELLQAEFESHTLEVVVVPSRHYVNEGGGIRVAVSRNAIWYRQFCARHPSGRQRRKAAHDTRIKRRNVASLLATLIARGRSCSKYAPEIIQLARSRVAASPRKEAVAC